MSDTESDIWDDEGDEGDELVEISIEIPLSRLKIFEEKLRELMDEMGFTEENHLPLSSYF